MRSSATLLHRELAAVSPANRLLAAPTTHVAATQPFQTLSGPGLTLQFKPGQLSPISGPGEVGLSLPLHHPASIGAYQHVALCAFMEFAAAERPTAAGATTRAPPIADWDAYFGALNWVSMTARLPALGPQRFRHGGERQNQEGSSNHQLALPTGASIEPVFEQRRRARSLKLTLHGVGDQQMDLATLLMSGEAHQLHETAAARQRKSLRADRVSPNLTLGDSEMGALDEQLHVVRDIRRGSSSQAFQLPSLVSLDHSPCVGSCELLQSGGFKQWMRFCGDDDGGVTDEDDSAQGVLAAGGDAEEFAMMEGADGPAEVPFWLVQGALAEFAENVVKAMAAAGAELPAKLSGPLSVVAHNSCSDEGIVYDAPLVAMCAKPKVFAEYFTKPWDTELGLPVLTGQPCVAIYVELWQDTTSVPEMIGRRPTALSMKGTFFFTPVK